MYDHQKNQLEKKMWKFFAGSKI